MQTELTINAAELGINLDQYFGLWAVEESRFMAMFEQVSKMDLRTHIEQQGTTNIAAPATAQAGGIAMIEINGVMTKRGSSMSRAGATSLIRRQVQNAARDPDIGGILLVIDSPGGSSSGTADLANAVAEAAQKKPVYAFIEDLGASAAYWVASQATKIFANDRTAVVGSIGTFLGLYDMSGAAAMQGIKPVVIKSGSLKGAGFPGTEITTEQKEVWQALVDQTQAEFTSAIAKGRKMPGAKVEELATGQVFMAADALQSGLIDGIQSFDATVNQLQSAIGVSTSPRRPMAMSNEPAGAAVASEPKAATYQELKAGCIGADSAFICSQMDKGATLPQAMQAWMTEQNTRIEAAKTTAAAPARPGVDPLTSSSNSTASSDSDPIAAWNDAIDAKVKAGLPKAKAVASLARQNPELRAAYVEAFNAERRSA